jgi:hypothetical protein
VVPRLNKCPDKGGDYVDKYLKVGVNSFSLDFVNTYFKCYCVCIFDSGRPTYIYIDVLLIVHRWSRSVRLNRVKCQYN